MPSKKKSPATLGFTDELVNDVKVTVAKEDASYIKGGIYEIYDGAHEHPLVSMAVEDDAGRVIFVDLYDGNVLDLSKLSWPVRLLPTGSIVTLTVSESDGHDWRS
jgi:hypothetical protein